MNIDSCTKVGCILRGRCSGCIGKSAPLKYFSKRGNGEGDADGKIRMKRRLCPPTAETPKEMAMASPFVCE